MVFIYPVSNYPIHTWQSPSLACTSKRKYVKIVLDLTPRRTSGWLWRVNTDTGGDGWRLESTTRQQWTCTSWEVGSLCHMKIVSLSCCIFCPGLQRPSVQCPQGHQGHKGNRDQMSRIKIYIWYPSVISQGCQWIVLVMSFGSEWFDSIRTLTY